jgi:hypothetical protein
MNAITDGAHKMQQMVTEEIQVAGNELITRVKALMSEGRVRHIKVKSASGETYFEVPLAVGMIGGAALAWASPFLAMAGALAGLVSSVKLEVVREGDAAAAGAKAIADKTKRRVAAAGKTAKRTAAGIVPAAKKAGAKGSARVVAAAKRVPAKAAKAAARSVAEAAATATKATKGVGRKM